MIRACLKALGASLLLALVAWNAAAQTLGPTPPLSPTPGYINLDTSKLPNTRSLFAKIRTSATANDFGRMIVIGDSSTGGTGCGTGANFVTGARTCAWPYRLSTALNAQSIIATTPDNVVGGGSTLGISDSYYPNLVAGAGWSLAGTSIGPNFRNSTTTNALAFTPTQNINTCDIFYITAGGGAGTFTVNFDGGATLATQATTGAAAPGSIRVTDGGAAAAHTVNIQRNGTGGQINITGIDCWDSATNKLHVVNMGWGGSVTADWVSTSSATTAYNTLGLWATVPGGSTPIPVVTVILLQINDENTGVSLSTYRSNLQTLITKMQTYGDVILMTSYPIGSGISRTTMDTYVSTIRDLALVNNLEVVDLNQRFVQYNTPAGIWRDTLHLTAMGYSDIATAAQRPFLLQ